VSLKSRLDRLERALPPVRGPRVNIVGLADDRRTVLWLLRDDGLMRAPEGLTLADVPQDNRPVKVWVGVPLEGLP
jgi:hypothetical protein